MSELPQPRFTPIAQPAEHVVHRLVATDPEADSRAEWQVESSDDFDLLQLIGVLWRGKSIIILGAILAFLVGGLYVFEIAEPKYAATARLALQARDQKVVNLESVISGVSTEQAAINTELEVIRSRGLIERLVDDFDLVADPEFNATLRVRRNFSVAEGKRLVRGAPFWRGDGNPRTVRGGKKACYGKCCPQRGLGFVAA